MIELNTDRLRIVQLDREIFELLTCDRAKMESNLGVLNSDYDLDEIFVDIMKMSLELALNNQDHFQWYVDWQIILKSENKIIGSLGFKGKPNEKSEVEIGYGINEKYQKYGYMTEAIKSVVKWAIKQNGVNCVIAETERDNIASERVLIKNNFKTYDAKNDCIWWRYPKQITNP
ncbi:GNAT family N-acetyltransferase [Paraclostridium sordellii]